MKKEEIDLLETLAELEHEQWMNWAKNLIEKESLSIETTRVDGKVILFHIMTCLSS